MILLGWLMLQKITNKKFRFLLGTYFIYDLFMYYNQVIYSNQSALIILLIIFSQQNHLFTKNVYTNLMRYNEKNFNC